ncbi:MAG TPA: hypothetical protein PKU97_12775 [Kofleriaceae bacterium]|nr:hypothetical protein [Kofleriaceae bacterium]
MAVRGTWHIAEHGPLEALGKNLWQVEATLPALPLGRRMVIARYASGELLVHNAVACDPPTMAAIEALGPISFVIVPSGFHRMDVPAFAARYPTCKILAMPRARGRVAARARVDGGPELLPADRHTRWEPLDGVPSEGVLLHDTSDGVVAVFNDCLQNHPDRLPGVKGLILRALGSTGGLKVTPIARRFLVTDAAAHARQLRRLAELGPVLIVPGHGALVRRDCAESLRAVADSLG